MVSIFGFFLLHILFILYTTSSHRILQVVDLHISIRIEEWKEAKGNE